MCMVRNSRLSCMRNFALQFIVLPGKQRRTCHSLSVVIPASRRRLLLHNKFGLLMIAGLLCCDSVFKRHLEVASVLLLPLHFDFVCIGTLQTFIR